MKENVKERMNVENVVLLEKFTIFGNRDLLLVAGNLFLLSKNCFYC